ncbi:hypothetical protein M569_14903 [Genlisea aurea]|uniref:AN1-type domain-containing protein n=1 Tax=Genlisea aurea TaxID=192259 RepID=S8DB33_9LAMI|nr:hypothetical protein M569_14903 [Genlisea aurea]
MTGGTEAFPDLGSHCRHPDCNQLDFLPFTCNACSEVRFPFSFLLLSHAESISDLVDFPQIFCLRHRSYESHGCPNSDAGSRRVTVCETCSSAFETTGRAADEVEKILERHARSGDCDPTRREKKKKPACAVRRCKEVLTFSNTAACKSCGIKTCLKHRFPADHACNTPPPPSSSNNNIKLLKAALAIRNGKDCSSNNKKIAGSNSRPILTTSS